MLAMPRTAWRNRGPHIAFNDSITSPEGFWLLHLVAVNRRTRSGGSAGRFRWQAATPKRSKVRGGPTPTSSAIPTRGRCGRIRGWAPGVMSGREILEGETQRIEVAP